MEQPDLLGGRKILLGVSGSIAAYKAVDLVRRLRERSVEVRVAMTKNAAAFVSPLTFETLSGLPVLIDEFGSGERTSIGHIEIAKGLDAALIAPATANIIGKIAAGIADDSLTTAVLALACPLIIAPAMNDRMYGNPAVRRNMEILKTSGIRFIEPGTGSLACGVSGPGRLAEPEQIIGGLESLFAPKDFAGRTVLVTAGPTREAVDAVRYISNPSTGKMGYAIACEARDRGAEVILISGPTALVPPTGVRMIPVVSARDMHAAVRQEVGNCDIVVMAAAVSDFAPVQPSTRKIKKDEAPDTIRLERTQDILHELGTLDAKRVLVGFAAETDDVEQNARKKLKGKNLDLVVVNDLMKAGSGFGADTNCVTLIDRHGRKTDLAIMPKSEVARAVMSAVAEIAKSRLS